ncbi:gamma-glutamyl-gamma-aminobutyrate hydrolase family protein [Pectinatus sottacetonis]|uniref:gamma-glutamyl-gamma-aminobutyrate hydrolase family protein n=1 Tax=Pectinatus sottacetonis TaxID=1002795 RepID=UPI0018C59E37|nr:gamma-glutamyl-gamma-aminobutyrate hydrolase family protein [Pectinatus sottacetonis]
MRKPIIGISGSILADDSGVFRGYPRAYVNSDYVRSVEDAGGVPVIIPFEADEANIKATIELCDGLILSGGQDVSPLNYGEEPLQGIGDVFPERDKFDFSLIRAAMDRLLPVLAICRGHQIINVYNGGTLYQDLSYDKNCTIKHLQNQRPELGTHTIILEKNSRLADIIGKTEIITNSFHHQTIKTAGSGLEITGRAKDGTIEAFEHNNYPWLISIQFHPEMMSAVNEDMKKIFVALITAAKKR